MTDTQPVKATLDLPDELVIDNLDTLKVIADPLRKRILSMFDKPKTVKAVAGDLGTSPSKLYYHVNMLEEHGLLRVTETRIVSGIIEKHYQIAARMFKVKSGLLSPTTESDDDNLNQMLTNMLDYTKEEIRSSARAGIIQFGDDAQPHKRLNMSFMNIMLTEAQAIAFHARLQALIDDLNALEGEDQPDEQEYIIQTAMFPSNAASVTDDELDERA